MEHDIPELRLRELIAKKVMAGRELYLDMIPLSWDMVDPDDKVIDTDWALKADEFERSGKVEWVQIGTHPEIVGRPAKAFALVIKPMPGSGVTNPNE